jgi:hypothetical protein
MQPLGLALQQLSSSRQQMMARSSSSSSSSRWQLLWLGKLEQGPHSARSRLVLPLWLQECRLVWPPSVPLPAVQPLTDSQAGLKTALLTWRLAGPAVSLDNQQQQRLQLQWQTLHLLLLVTLLLMPLAWALLVLGTMWRRRQQELAGVPWSAGQSLQRHLCRQKQLHLCLPGWEVPPLPLHLPLQQHPLLLLVLLPVAVLGICPRWHQQVTFLAWVALSLRKWRGRLQQPLFSCRPQQTQRQWCRQWWCLRMYRLVTRLQATRHLLQPERKMQQLQECGPAGRPWNRQQLQHHPGGMLVPCSSSSSRSALQHTSRLCC